MPDSLYREYAISNAFARVKSGEEPRKRHADSRIIIVTILNVRAYMYADGGTYQSWCDVGFDLIWRGATGKYNDKN